MDQRLRQRGWSIQSSDDPSSHRGGGRARAESTATIATEPSLSHDEKVALMNSAFEGRYDDVEIVVPTTRMKHDENEKSDYIDMFGEEEKSFDGGDEKEEHPKKRRKLDPSEIQNEKQKVELTQFQQEKLDLAKSKLSKWAARLFDPNRPRGLVEPPQTWVISSIRHRFIYPIWFKH